MPKESLSLYIDIQSGSSVRTLNSLADKTRALDKETQELNQTTEAFTKANNSLMKEQTRLQSEMKAAQKTVNDLQKAYDEYGDEMMKLDLDQAIENHAKLKSELAGVNSQINANQRTYKDYLETVRKGGLEEQGTGLGDIARGLAAGQVGQMLAASLGGLGQSVLTSAIGTPEASLISDTLSSAIAGGAAGMIAGPIGAAIGAGVGALSGLISGGTKIFEAKDDAFKEYYGGLYEDVSGRAGEMVEGGSTIAGGREQTRMAFAQRLGGEQEARDYLAQVEQMAAQTNYEYDEIVGYAKLLLNSYDPDEVFGVLRDLSDATAGLNLSSSDVNMMISGLSRMRTTGKATQEYLNYFRERGVDTDQALADSLGVEKSSIADLVKDGDIKGADAADAILSYIQETFGGLSDTLAGTFDAMTDNLGDVTASLQAAGGDAYNALRKEGVGAQMEAYEGELGDAIKEINAVMGENQARKENLQDQYMREVLDRVLNGRRGELWSTFDEEQQNTLTEMSEQYAYLMRRYENGDTDAGAELESLYEQAQALGQAYFDNSDFVQTLNETERDEIEAIRDAVAGLDNAYTALYNLNQTMSYGLTATIKIDHTAVGLTTLGGAWDTDPNPLSGGSASKSGWYDDGGTFHSYAFGLERVPYDNYPALLHEGERVLTASEARAQERAAPVQLTVTGNNFVGTPEELADQLWAIIVRKLEREQTAAAPK